MSRIFTQSALRALTPTSVYLDLSFRNLPVCRISAFRHILGCSVAVIPLPQAAAVAAEGPCPALPGGSFPPHVSPQVFQVTYPYAKCT